MSPESARLRAVRGATTVDADSFEGMKVALEELLAKLTAENGISEPDVVNVFMTITNDIHSDSPARITRMFLGWQNTPILCSVEPDIEGFPALCVRYLIQFYSERGKAEMKPVYMRGAAVLRPDLK